MIDIALSALFYAAAALLYKLGGKENRNFLAVNLAVFGGGTAAAVISGAVIRDLTWDVKTVVLGLVAGSASVTANITFLLAVRSGRLAISWTIFNLALVVPVIVGICLWHEEPTWCRFTGFWATTVALVLLGTDTTNRCEPAGVVGDQRNRRTWRYLIVAAFLANGLIMTVNKAFQQSGSSGSFFGYLSIYFGTGLAVSLALYLWHRPPFGKSEMLLGSGIGLCSVLAGFFLLQALTQVPAIVAFPSVSAGNLTVVALFGATVFSERLGWKGWLGLIVGVAALVLFNY